VIITIDGPAGSGKSTAARLLSDRLGFFHLDTGAIYRAIAYLSKKADILWSDEEGVEKIALNIDIDFIKDGDRIKVMANGEDVTEKIRTPEISIGASDVGRLKRVRAALDIQRRFGNKNNIVAEGRDMGTVIFPYADVKFYLSASVEVRADRRYKELIKKGINQDYKRVLEEVRIRDEQDSNREVAPLRPADDAIIVDTDRMGIEDVLNFLEDEVRKRWR